MNILATKFASMRARERRQHKRADSLAGKPCELPKSRQYRLGGLVLLPIKLARRVLKLARRVLKLARRVLKLARRVLRWRVARTAVDEQLTDADAVALREARSAFFKRGAVHQPLAVYRAVMERATVPEEHQRLVRVLEGYARLDAGFAVPPRQPNVNYVPLRGRVIYGLHSALPHRTNGYSTRSHGIASGVRAAAVDLTAVTRAGFPWDQKAGPAPVGVRRVDVVDGVPYVTTSGPRLNDTPLDVYIAVNADMMFRECQAARAEVMHAASNHIVGLSALIAARRLGIPFVYEVRGLWEISQSSVSPEWGGSDRYRLAAALETVTAREADRVVALTEELKAELVRRGVNETRITVVPNCVDPQVFRPQERDEALARHLTLPEGVPCIGFVGSVVAYEGLELLVDAVALLAERGVPCVVVIVGDGPELASVKARVESKGVMDRFRFVGRVPFTEVERYFTLMDIMPCPRLSVDVTEMVAPLKPLEAMAASKAVVLSDVSPHLALAGQGERAMLFRSGDAVDLADVLQTLVRDPTRRTTLGEAARSWILESRTWDHAGRMLACVYDDLRALAAEQRATTPGRAVGEMKLGLIADRFTTDALSAACTIERLMPDTWQEQLDAVRLDAVIIESAWRGNDGAWEKMVGYYGDESFETLSALIRHCRESGIPTIFWNKEDPVHFNRFRQTAGMCDHVFTTDANCIERYLVQPDRQARTVASLPFFAAPRLHNPLPGHRPWVHTIAYAGTYYGERYPERSRYLDRLLAAAMPFGLTIYDRQHLIPGSPYAFPPALAPFVEGGLDYADMVAAYKAHPVHINVNSVLDSQTMFSRRVMEIAASGGVVISGPGGGLACELGGAVVVVADEAEARQHLDVLMTDEAARNERAWSGLREVMRRHTVEHRLTDMLRTAGLAVRAPALPEVDLVAPTLDGDGARRITEQSIAVRRVLTAALSAEARDVLDGAGIAVGAPTDGFDVGEGWILVLRDGAGASALPTTAVEDLLAATWWSDTPVIGTRNLRPNGVGPGAGQTIVGHEAPEGPLLLVRLDEPRARAILEKLRHTAPGPDWVVAGVPAITLRYAPKLERKQRNQVKARTVAVAGHDLKFFTGFLPALRAKGVRILFDHWQGHSWHDEGRSQWILEQADTVFCEWCLGNAVWYARNKKPGQRLIGRLHAQEARSPLLERISFEAFDKVVFVGPHIRDGVISRTGLDAARSLVIPNAVHVAALNLPKVGDYRHSLGLVGMVPRMKRLDLALDLLERLLARDPEFRLYVKGRRPEEYAWMADRQEEMDWYQAQYARIEVSPALSAAVQFDPHGSDMPEWYSKIGFPLSVSDFESFHLTVADGAASGGNPIVLPWEGADTIYPSDWIVPDLDAAVERVLRLAADDAAFAAEGAAAKAFAAERFAFDKVSAALVDAILGEQAD